MHKTNGDQRIFNGIEEFFGKRIICNSLKIKITNTIIDGICSVQFFWSVIKKFIGINSARFKNKPECGWKQDDQE